jgi:hypothetical protein
MPSTTAREGAPGGSVFLHIGEPKTGTTYLQRILWRNREQLAAQGLVVPGKGLAAHWAAAQDLRGVQQTPNDPFGPVRGRWDRLAAEALRARRSAVISHELISAVDPEQAARAVESLRPARVEVILTVRDIATLLPAEWQETVKHRNRREWEDWLGDVIDTESVLPNRRDYWFWRVHDSMELLRIWSGLVSPDRVHVITVPPRGSAPDLLWDRFSTLVGIDANGVETTTVPSNASLGLTEVELLRRLNAAMSAEFPGWFYMRNVKNVLAHGALAARPSTLGRLELPPERQEWARGYADNLISELRASDVHVVGDLNELLPPATATAVPRPRDARPDEMLDAALVAINALLAELGKTQGVYIVTEGTQGASEPAVGGHQSRLKGRAIALAQRHPSLHRLRRGYWHLANATRHLRGTARPAPPVGGEGD